MCSETHSKRPESEAEQHPEDSKGFEELAHEILPDRSNLAIFQGKSTQQQRALSARR
jgi:hypothetical protein